MRVLCYSRPWSYRRFRAIASLAFPDAEIRYVSDFLGYGTERLQERFYSYLKDLDGHRVEVPLEKGCLDDIVVRCRLLRNISREEADRLVHAMSRSVRDIYDSVDPDVVLSSPVDSYVVDLIRLEAARRGIPFLGLISVFVNGFFRLTARGERIVVRTPGDAECEAVLDEMLAKEYEPEYLRRPGSRLGSTLKGYKARARNLARWAFFRIQRLVSSDPLCYHAWGSEVVARSNASLSMAISPGDPDWRDSLSRRETRKLFIPLQYVPEATVDYWCDNVEVIDYYRVLFRIIESVAGKDITIVVKEHPGALGLRPAGIYHRLASYDHVLMVPAHVHSNHVLDLTQAVVVWTGTIGFEAALRGTPVLHLGNPFYTNGSRMLYVQELGKFPQQVEEVLSQQPVPVDRSEQLDMIRHVLAGCLPGCFPGFYDEEMAGDLQLQQFERVARSLRQLDLGAIAKAIRSAGQFAQRTAGT